MVARGSADGIVGLPGISLIRQKEPDVETPMRRKYRKSAYDADEANGEVEQREEVSCGRQWAIQPSPKRRAWEVAQSRGTLNLRPTHMFPSSRPGRDWILPAALSRQVARGHAQPHWLLTGMRDGTVIAWWSLHFEVHCEDGR